MEEQIERLQTALRKCAQWAGVDISELIEAGYIQEDDI